MALHPDWSVLRALQGSLQAAGLDYTRGPFYPSLAYRLVQIATGKLDATVVRRGSQDWDLAGAAAILGECGIGFEKYNDIKVGDMIEAFAVERVATTV